MKVYGECLDCGYEGEVRIVMSEIVGKQLVETLECPECKSDNVRESK